MRLVYNINDVNKYFIANGRGYSNFQSKAMPMLSKSITQPGQEPKKVYRPLKEVDLNAYERLLQEELKAVNSRRKLLIKDLKSLDHIRSNPTNIE